MTISYPGHGLDRADHSRTDPALLAALRARADARLLLMDALSPVLDAANGLSYGAAADLPPDAETVFLGMDGELPVFAVVPAEGDDRPAYLQKPNWAAIALLGLQDMALYATARSLVDWHARHRFCARCGAPTHIAKGGWQRDCPACTAQHFPRTDPVAIMLVEHDGDLLLGRGTQFPPRSYSALAGFIEPGETIEQAVAREVWEEAGVRVHSVRYIGSQPWPFPSQLMIGCHALAEGRDLTVDYTEIADARWFTRAEVAEAMERRADGAAFIPPPAHAIANAMLGWWLERAR
ncbi:NAD(+) diphosphatase [Alteraurantiacibacter palmitatis]|uniref:NAD(+) diphosphatase n=1 Tax=Alteraurantiacibacter palmitatis TaxID=2054628 RepID=A0ABV7E3X4_9SPHN